MFVLVYLAKTNLTGGWLLDDAADQGLGQPDSQDWNFVTDIHCVEDRSQLRMMPPSQRTYIQKDGKVVPHGQRPLSARLRDLVASIILFFTLFLNSLFQVFILSGLALNIGGRA